MQFFECFSSFAKEIDKKQQIQNFYWLIINSLNSRATGRNTGSWRSGTPCPALTCVESAKNHPVLKKMNELSENVSFDSKFVLAFEIHRLKVSGFFLKCQFFKVFPG